MHMTRHPLAGNERFSSAFVGFDEPVGAFVLVCFEANQTEWPAIWHPRVQSFDELERLVQSCGLTLPPSVAVVLKETQSRARAAKLGEPPST